MILTKDEKNRFITYLKAEKLSSDLLLKQFLKMKVPQQLIDENKLLSLSCEVLIKRMTSGEEMGMTR